MSVLQRLRLRTSIVVTFTFVALLSGLVALPTVAHADENDAPIDEQGVRYSAETPEGVYVPEDAFDGSSGDELLRGYIEQQFAEELPTQAGEPERFQAKAGEALTGVDAIAYRELKALVEEVAAGKRTSTRLSIPVTTLTGGRSSWTASELGVSSALSGNRVNSAAMNAAHDLIYPHLATVLYALLADCPYDLYWFDKTNGISFSGVSYEADADNLYVVTKNITFSFTVSTDYATSMYAVDPSTGTRVGAAVACAKDIVATTEGMQPVERLEAYCETVCDLASYNDAAMEDLEYPYGDPWQLIYVFDRDESTEVVCEGYAKAFQYLCDLSGFENIESRLVTGFIDSGAGEDGSHMWNILTMPDGNNYLADITNCDTDMIGEDGGLFIAPYSSGSLNGGYTFETPNGTLSYSYDNETRTTWSDDQLTLSAIAYGADIDAVVVYRLYNHRTSEHLWTTGANEYQQLPIITKGDWRQEGVAWYAPDDEGTPVYRLYNKKMGDHYYSMDANEIAVLTSKYGWTVDNGGEPAFWSAAKDDEGAIPLYCVYNSKLKKGQHHFTADENESNVLVANAGWRYEKVAFYGYVMK